jgi:hypothetical protein
MIWRVTISERSDLAEKIRVNPIDPTISEPRMRRYNLLCAQCGAQRPVMRQRFSTMETISLKLSSEQARLPERATRAAALPSNSDSFGLQSRARPRKS